MQLPSRRKLRPKDARSSNLSLVLQAIFNDDQLSRADLARITGLTKVTISTLVAELIEAELVEETGTSDQGRPGKPSTLLGLNAAARDVLAMDLSEPDLFRGAVLSLTGQIRTKILRPLDGAVGAAAIDIAIELAQELATAASNPILGLGIGTPGTVDSSGTVLSAPNLQWARIPLQEKLTQTLQLPAWVENDANAAVLAERRFDAGTDNLIRIQISRGVGAGLLVGGGLVKGVASDGGEIGHVVIDETGPRCSCGKTGCLEAWISTPAIAKRRQVPGADPVALLTDSGHKLGLALSPVVGMLGINQILIGGPTEIVNPAFLEATQRCVTERTRSDFRPELQLHASSLGTDAVLLGAAALVLWRELGVA